MGRYLSGQITESRLLAETNTGNSPTRVERLCEAYFYVGMTHLIAGDVIEADEYIRKCIGTGVTNYYEYKIARAELSRLGQSN